MRVKWQKTQNSPAPSYKVFVCENCCFCWLVFGCCLVLLLVGFYLFFVFCDTKIFLKKNKINGQKSILIASFIMLLKISSGKPLF